MATPAPATARRADRSGWTRPLKVWFVALEVVGIYGIAAVLLVLTFGVWFVLLLADVFFQSPMTGLPQAAWIFLGEVFGQPALVIAWLAVMVAAAVLVTWGAFHDRDWAHWAALALVAATMLLPIRFASYAEAGPVWAVVLVFCAQGAAFAVAMTYALLKHGPWGVPARA